MPDTEPSRTAWRPTSWPRCIQGAVLGCLAHIVIAALATAVAFAVASWSDACWDRYHQECWATSSACDRDPYAECDPSPIVLAVVAALQSGPGHLLLSLPFFLLPSVDLDLSWIDPSVLWFWIPQLVSLLAYGSAGAIAYSYLRPRTAFSVLALGLLLATAATTFYWALWLMTI